MGVEVPGFHHFISVFSRTGFLFFHSIYGYFKNIYCEGGGNKAQKRGNTRNHNKYRRKVGQRKRYVGKLTHIGSRSHGCDHGRWR